VVVNVFACIIAELWDEQNRLAEVMSEVRSCLEAEIVKLNKNLPPHSVAVIKDYISFVTTYL
jgi:hypothetical protein